MSTRKMTAKEFRKLSSNEALYVTTSHENYEALVSAGVRRNSYFPVEKLLDRGYMFMYIASGQIEANDILRSGCELVELRKDFEYPERLQKVLKKQLKESYDWA